MKVLIQSFGFTRTGHPEDKTGKGGGFVFDCRAIDLFDYSLRNNPVAPVSHFHLTGLDPRIAGPLDRDPEVQEFFRAVWTMVGMDINKCLNLGLPVITVNFGCTAGQHRSVYMAERLAKQIKSAFPQVDLELIHLERSHWPTKS